MRREKTNLPLGMVDRERLPAYISIRDYHNIYLWIYRINFALYTRRETEFFSRGQMQVGGAARCLPGDEILYPSRPVMCSRNQFFVEGVCIR
jgi:hypothetical protein